MEIEAEAWSHVIGKVGDGVTQKPRNSLGVCTALRPVSTRAFISFSFSFLLFRATPAVYRDSQARGPVGDIAASLHHSHSSVGLETCLRSTPQLTATPDP